MLVPVSHNSNSNNHNNKSTCQRSRSIERIVTATASQGDQQFNITVEPNLHVQTRNQINEYISDVDSKIFFKLEFF